MTNLNGLSNFDFIKVLKNFSKSEMSEFSRLLRSPFYNNHSTIVRLFDELRKYHPLFDDKKLSKEYLFGIVNNGKKFNDAVFRKYFSRLYKLSEIYLNILENRFMPVNTELNVLRQFSKRSIDELYERKLREINKKFTGERKISMSNSFTLFKLNEIKIYHYSKKNQASKLLTELIESNIHIYNYFLSVASINSNQIITNSVSYRSPNNFEYFRKIINNFDLDQYRNELKNLQRNNNEKDLLLLEIISNDIKLHSNTYNEKAYLKLRELLFNNINQFDNNYVYYLLQRMNVFCITEHFKYNKKYQKDLFENYKYIVELRLYIQEKVSNLNLFDFRAILFSATKNNKFEWLKNFITEHKGLFGKVPGNDIYNYGMAYLSFSMKNYDRSLDHLTSISSKNLLFAIDTYIIKSKIYYEKGYMDSAASVSDAFRHFLKKNESISEEFKTGLINYLKYYKNLLTIKEKYDLKKYLKIYESIKDNKKLRNKYWLIEKAEELLNK